MGLASIVRRGGGLPLSKAQTKTVTPSASQQIITPDSGKYLSQVTVEASPSTFKYVSVLNAESLVDRTSSSIYVGSTGTFKYFLTAWNGTFGIQYSDNGSSWTKITETQGSTGGSSSGVSTTPTTVKSGTISGHLYYRAWCQPYNNGWKGSVSLAIGN